MMTNVQLSPPRWACPECEALGQVANQPCRTCRPIVVRADVTITPNQACLLLLLLDAEQYITTAARRMKCSAQVARRIVDQLTSAGWATIHRSPPNGQQRPQVYCQLTEIGITNARTAVLHQYDDHAALTLLANSLGYPSVDLSWAEQ